MRVEWSEYLRKLEEKKRVEEQRDFYKAALEEIQTALLQKVGNPYEICRRALTNAERAAVDKEQK